MEGCRKLRIRTKRRRSYRNIGRNNRRTGGKLVEKVRRRDHLKFKPRPVLNKHSQTHTHKNPPRGVCDENTLQAGFCTPGTETNRNQLSTLDFDKRHRNNNGSWLCCMRHYRPVIKEPKGPFSNNCARSYRM